ncbi:MAG: SIR2 family protein [Lachnospiraceae bacterium]|nr:SIR2 family protein [Lachnospiraceae bacterium]
MPKSILDKIVEKRKMPVLFIGSGISKRYLYGFPDWEGLLRDSFKSVNPDPYYYNRYVEQFKREGNSPFEINTKLATIIENDFNAAFYARKIKIKIGNTKNPKWVDQGVSPYKMFLVSYFKKLKVNSDPLLLQEIESFRLLKNKILAVITTNYDTFIESEILRDDYQVFCHQNELFSADSYNIAEIYKIHGSVLDAKSLVITEKDYADFNSSRKLIIAKMLTLFAESPIIFMGYSFTDENIQHIIEDFLNCLTVKELSIIGNHFVFISYKKGEKRLLETKRTIFTSNKIEIPITEITTDNYGAIYEKLNNIIPGIAASRVRETRKIIKQIVDQNITNESAESVIVDIDDLDNIDLSTKPLAIAIGYRDSILNKVGYGILDVDSIIEDILFDNKKLNADNMCFDRFKSISSTHLIPVFKYAKGCTVPIPSSSKLNDYINARNSIDKIISKSQLKSINALPTASTIDELHTAMNSQNSFDKKAGVLLKSIGNFTIDEIRTECQSLFREISGTKITSTCFKRCVMYIDFKENYTKKS